VLGATPRPFAEEKANALRTQLVIVSGTFLVIRFAPVMELK